MHDNDHASAEEATAQGQRMPEDDDGFSRRTYVNDEPIRNGRYVREHDYSDPFWWFV